MARAATIVRESLSLNMLRLHELPGSANFCPGKTAGCVSAPSVADPASSAPSAPSEELCYLSGLPPFLLTGAYAKVASCLQLNECGPCGIASATVSWTLVAAS